MQLTPNYRLMKPDGTDPVNVQDLNSNMDALDDELIKKLDKTGDASNVVTKFSQATSRNNLTPGEKLSLSLGKIAKWFADMKTVAFSGKYTDLTERPTIPAGGIADASKIIDNVDDISALTQSGYIMGGLAGKQLISDLGGNRFGFTADGQPGYKKAGADTVYPFKGPLKIPYMTLSAGNKTFLPLDATGYKNLSFSFASKHPIMKFWIYGSSKMPTSREELLGTEIYFKEAEAVDYKGTVNLDISAYNCVTLYIIPTVDYVIGAIYIDNFVMQ